MVSVVLEVAAVAALAVLFVHPDGTVIVSS
jgi:hypothetical protein